MTIQDLHINGITAMFIASKFEDIHPLKMKTVHEKIAHKKLSVDEIKGVEMKIMSTLAYKINAPTCLDFLKQYLLDILGIRVLSKGESKEKLQKALEKNAQIHEKRAKGELPPPKDSRTLREARFDNNDVRMIPLTEEEEIEDLLIEKMSIYLAKMCMHDYYLAGKLPSLIGIGSLYVALKICEQLRKRSLISDKII